MCHILIFSSGRNFALTYWYFAILALKWFQLECQWVCQWISIIFYTAVVAHTTYSLAAFKRVSAHIQRVIVYEGNYTQVFQLCMEKLVSSFSHSQRICYTQTEVQRPSWNWQTLVLPRRWWVRVSVLLATLLTTSVSLLSMVSRKEFTWDILKGWDKGPYSVGDVCFCKIMFYEGDGVLL